MSIYLCLAGSKKLKSVVIASIKEFKTREESEAHGKTNLETEVLNKSNVRVASNEYIFKAFRLDGGDSALIGRRMHQWFVREIKMARAEATETVRRVGKGVGEVMGIPDKGANYRDWVKNHVGQESTDDGTVQGKPGQN